MEVTIHLNLLIEHIGLAHIVAGIVHRIRFMVLISVEFDPAGVNLGHPRAGEKL
jgi:hypothetical protein